MLSKYMKFVCAAIVMLLNVDLYAQSAETGSPFNQYMSADAGVNPLSGTVSVSKNLASLSAGDVQASFAMSYSGNVTQSVNNRNDVSPTGWLGLGWAMGFAKIICEHNNSMSLDDDSYYLLTAEGNRHKIIKQEVRKGEYKWWITNLPYWKIEPEFVENVNYGKYQYKFIVGWVVTDDSGRKYRYGDFLSKNDMESLGRNDFQNEKLLGNATQYVLCWPDTYGMVGENLGGTPRLYPNVWNLQKMEDLKGNYLSYTYMQKREALVFKGTPSIAKYTKECYLQKVESSDGERVEFILKPKGEGAFVDEFLDLLGNREVDENDADAFVDPVERFYLEKVVFYGKNGARVSTVEFCYEALSFAPKTNFSFESLNVAKDSRYVKRILKSVIFTNSSNQVVDRESYEYNTNESSAVAENNAPFGMMTAIQGPNCGRVEFKYTYKMTSLNGGTKLHSQQVINLKKISSIGYLEDGTPFIAGYKDGYVAVYVRSFGKWVESHWFGNDENMKESKDGSFIIGDKGWFIYVRIVDRDRSEITYSPVVWNGKEFEKQSSIKDGGVRENVTVGAGFIFKARIDDDGKRSHITITIPWSVWGRPYYMDDFVNSDGSTHDANHFPAEDGYLDRQAIKIFASTNHVGIFYLGTDGGNNGRLRIYTFNHDKTKLVLTYSSENLDDDNTYMFSGNMLYGATESKGVYGHNAEVFQWYEPNGNNSEAYWHHRTWELDGVQSEPSIQASGSNYFVVKHDDGDDMSLFYWDGESWSTPYKNQDMVDGDTWDVFYESEWDGCSGNDFFIAREPLQINYYISFTIRYPTFWKIKKKKIKIPIWTSTNRGALLDRYQLRDGVWNNTGAKNLDNSSKKTSVMVGTDWYIDRTSNMAFTWDGAKWNEETFKDNDITWTDDYRSLGGNFFVVESGKASTIYFKKSDSFKKDFGFYIVTQKVIEDPVLDKVVKYDYIYGNKDIYGDITDVSFDFVNNTPIIAGYMVNMNGIGLQDKVLCRFDSKTKLGLGAGQICEEITRIPSGDDKNGIVTNNKKTIYERYDGDDQDPKWPTFIYQDRIKMEISENNKSKSIVQYGYSKLNGQISSVKTYLDGKEPNDDPSKDHPDKEKRIVYAAEKKQYEDMKRVNRLLEEYETRECLGACGVNGQNVVSANVSRYKKLESNNNYRVIWDVWTYKKMDKTSSYSFNESSLPVNDANWKKSSEYTTYENYKAVQSVDELDIKSAAFYENRVTGLLFGNVINAGYEESFLLPGTAVDDTKEGVEHSLDFRNNRYWIVPLYCGNATDWYNSHENNSCGKGGTVNPNYAYRDNPEYYGRFASNAILVEPGRGKNLRGTIKSENNKKYVFSAWIQGTNISPRKAYLHVDNMPVKEWDLLGNGKWQPVEWEGELTQNSHSFELRTDNDNSMRVQNVLFIPSNASATVTYWNRQWNKPVVTVNDRGIGSYSVLDDNGRVVQTFGEDNNGNLVKLSETEYRISDCRAYPAGTGNLVQLKINGNTVHGLKNGSIFKYIVPNNTDKIDVSWMTEQKNERVQYAFVKKGTPVKPEDWKSSCCGVLQDATLSLKDYLNWYLLVDVFPFDGNYYTIEIAKATTGWVDHGSPLSVGKKPVFASSSNPDYVFYLPKSGVSASKFDGNVWSEHKGNLNVNQNFLRADAYDGKSYVLTLPYVDTDSWTEKDGSGNTITRYNNTTALVCKPDYEKDFNQGACYNNTGNAGEHYDSYRLVVDNHKVPHVLLQKMVNVYTGSTYKKILDKNGNVVKDRNGKERMKEIKSGSVGKHLIVKKYEGNSWKTVGNTLRMDVEGLQTALESDIVSDGEVLDADMIWGSDGVPYVAYIGSVDSYNPKASINEVILDKDGNEKSVEENESTPNFVVVKRLYQGSEISSVISESVWAGLSKISNDQNSSKIPDVNGDILYATFNNEEMPITTAKRVKLAKGKNGMYLAVLYQLVPKEGSSVDMNVLKNKYALSVFKGTSQTRNVIYEDGTVEKEGILFDPILDQSISASIYSSSVEEEQRIIAYLDDSDPFDIEVYTDAQNNEYPYVMFANESNLNNLSVIKYNGSRWLSIGKPAFADVLNEKESADLAINEFGVPYVVYREGALSNNVLRRNHIVPQKYSANGDKDLTLLSMGNVPGTSIESNFRQYILNYGATVSSSVSQITINPTLSNVNDVCSIVVENNEEPVALWESNKSSCGDNSWVGSILNGFHNNSTLMNISLSPGPNSINVKVYGADNDFLAYNIAVYRDIVPEDGLSVVGDNGNTFKTDEKIVPTTDGTSHKEYTFISYGDSKKRTICFQFNAFWTMEFKSQIYHMGSCVDMVFPATCSDNYYEIINFSDGKGNVRIVKIKDGSCGSNKDNEFIIPFLSSSGTGDYPNSSSSEPPYYSSSNESSSSVSPNYSSSNVSSSSCGGSGCVASSSSSETVVSKCIEFVNGTGQYGENCYNSGLQDMEQGKCYTMNPDRANENPVWISETVSQTWWWVESPCVEVVASSSSVPPNYSSSSSCGYSCNNGSSSSISTNIPEEYTALMEYKVFATGHMNIADRVVLNGGSYGCASANVGSNANISIMLYATGDVELRNNSYTEQVVAGGSVSVQSGAQYGFMFNEPVNMPNLAVQNVPYGNEDLIVYGGQTVTVQPGMYKSLHIYAGANVTFVGGIYNFESFNIESDAKLSFNNSVTPIRVWVQNTFSLGDRVEVNTTGTAEDLFIYTNTSSLYLGVISSIRAVLVAPNATANIASRYTWAGQIWAREITIQPDAVVR